MVSPNREFPCNVSFDQLGNIGKPLGAIKFDEFMKNMISVEEAHVLQNVNPSSSCSSSSSTSPLFLGNFELNNGGALSKKPVDDVWKEIENLKHVNHMDSQSIQQKLSDTSLEDFLVRAGVINIGNQNAMISSSHPPLMAIDPMGMVSQQADWLQLPMAAQEQQLNSDFHVSESVYENPVIDVGYTDDQLTMTMPMPATEPQAAAEKKRRYSDDIMEKTIERRQKRMIKNRESALYHMKLS